MQDGGGWWRRRPSERQLPRLWRIEHLPGPRRRRTDWVRVFFIAVGALVVALVLVRAAVDSVANQATQRWIHEISGMDGTFQRVHVGLLPPRYEAERLKIQAAGAGSAASRPAFYAERIEIGISMRELLLRRRVVLGVRIDEPQLAVVRTSTGTPTKWGDVHSRLLLLPEVYIQRLEVRGGQLFVMDGTTTGEPRLWVHAVDAEATGLGTRPPRDDMGEDGEEEHVAIKVRGRFQRSGALALAASLDPWAAGLDLHLRAELRGLSITDLEQATTGAAPDVGGAARGAVDVVLDARIHDSALTGGIRSAAHNVQLSGSAAAAMVHRLRTWLEDPALSLPASSVSRAGLMSLAGHVDPRPGGAAWTAMRALLRNGFVQGISLALTPPAPAPAVREPPRAGPGQGVR